MTDTTARPAIPLTPADPGEPDNAKIGERLKAVRRARRLTLEEVAEASSSAGFGEGNPILKRDLCTIRFGYQDNVGPVLLDHVLVFEQASRRQGCSSSNQPKSETRSCHVLKSSF